MLISDDGMNNFLSSFSDTSVAGISITHWPPPGDIFSSKHYLRHPFFSFMALCPNSLWLIFYTVLIFYIASEREQGKDWKQTQRFSSEGGYTVLPCLRKLGAARWAQGWKPGSWCSPIMLICLKTLNFTEASLFKTNWMQTTPVLPVQSRYLSPNLLLWTIQHTPVQPCCLGAYQFYMTL